MIEQGQANRIARYLDRLREIHEVASDKNVFSQIAQLTEQHLKEFESAAIEEFHALLNSKIEGGYIRLELCGHLEDAGLLKGFILDKRKYRMRLEDETEESMRVIIEPKETQD